MKKSHNISFVHRYFKFIILFPELNIQYYTFLFPYLSHELLHTCVFVDLRIL